MTSRPSINIAGLARAGVQATAPSRGVSRAPVAVRVPPQRLGAATADGRACHLSIPAEPDLVSVLLVEDADKTRSQVWISTQIPTSMTGSSLDLSSIHDIPCRSAWRRLVPFLPAYTTQYTEPGNPVAVLARAELQLGQPLPHELWEFYRYRNGKAAWLRNEWQWAVPFRKVKQARLIGVDAHRDSSCDRFVCLEGKRPGVHQESGS